MKKCLFAFALCAALFSFASCGDEKDAVIKIGVYEPASGDNGAGGKQETLGIQYANSVTPTVTLGAKKAYCLSKLGDDYSGGLVKYFVEAFKKMGGEVVEETFPDGTT